MISAGCCCFCTGGDWDEAREETNRDDRDSRHRVNAACSVGCCVCDDILFSECGRQENEFIIKLQVRQLCHLLS